MKQAPLSTITESVGEAWSAGTGIVHDLGSTAVERASELASTAAERIPELPEKVDRLARRARRRLQPAKSRRSRRPVWIGVGAAALAAIAVVVVWRWRSRVARERSEAAIPRDYTERAAAAAVGD